MLQDQRVYDGTPIRVYVKIHGFHRPPGSMEFGGHLHKENHQAQSEERVHNVGLGLTNASLCESVEIVEPEDGLVRRWEGIAVAQVDTIERSVCVEPITEGNRLVEQLEDSVEVQDIPSSATTTSGVAAEDLAVPSPPKLRVRGIDDQSFATNTSGGSPVPRPRPRPRHRSLSDPTVRVSSRMISVAPSARSASDPTTDTVALPDLLGDLSIGDSQGDQYLEQSLATPPFSPSLNGVFLEAGGGGGGFPNVGPPMHVPWYPAVCSSLFLHRWRQHRL